MDEEKEDLLCSFADGKYHQICDCGAKPPHCEWCCKDLTDFQIYQIKARNAEKEQAS